MKVAILNISIGSYVVFWEGFYKSAEQYFLPGCEKHYFVYTDKKNLYASNSSNITILYQEDMGWPFNTMKRFAMFKRCERELTKFDYVFFVNGNAEFKQVINESFINYKKDLITIVHPGMSNTKIDKVPYERREESNAFVKTGKGNYYVQGAFIGGKSDAFIKMIDELDILIEEDLKNGIIAVWHDESFLNKYIIDRNDVQIAGRQYLYYEEVVFPWKPFILLRDKSKYIEKTNGRFAGRYSKKIKAKLWARNIIWTILIKLKIKKEFLNYSKEKYVDMDLMV